MSPAEVEDHALLFDPEEHTDGISASSPLAYCPSPSWCAEQDAQQMLYYHPKGVRGREIKTDDASRG